MFRNNPKPSNIRGIKRPPKLRESDLYLQLGVLSTGNSLYPARHTSLTNIKPRTACQQVFALVGVIAYQTDQPTS